MNVVVVAVTGERVGGAGAGEGARDQREFPARADATVRLEAVERRPSLPVNYDREQGVGALRVVGAAAQPQHEFVLNGIQAALASFVVEIFGVEAYVLRRR